MGGVDGCSEKEWEKEKKKMMETLEKLSKNKDKAEESLKATEQNRELQQKYEELKV